MMTTRTTLITARFGEVKDNVQLSLHYSSGLLDTLQNVAFGANSQESGNILPLAENFCLDANNHLVAGANVGGVGSAVGA